MAATPGMAVGSLLVCLVLLLASGKCQAITEPSEGELVQNYGCCKFNPSGKQHHKRSSHIGALGMLASGVLNSERLEPSSCKTSIRS
jgi:hypothetical protein